MNISDLMTRLPGAFNASAAGNTRCTVQFNLNPPAYATIADGQCVVTPGSAPKADVTLNVSNDDLIKMLTGKLSPVMAFMTGKLKVEGDLGLGQRVMGFFDSSKLV